MQKGFTLIELLIVLSITVVLSAAVVPIYGGLQVSTQLNNDSAQIIQTLRLARERSINGFADSKHGVKILSDRFILYKGNSYATRDSSYDREIVLDNALSLATDLSNGEVNFFRGQGLPDNFGSITITHESADSKIITINSFGIIKEQ